MLHSLVKLGVLAASLLGLLATASAETSGPPERYLRLAYANNSRNPQYAGAKKFADLVAERTGGKISIRLHPDATFGKDLDVLSSMRVGGVDLSIMNTNLLVGVAKEAGLIDLPYLFNSEAEAFAVLDGPVGQKIHAALEAKGLVGLAYFDMGYYHLHNNRRPINRLEDLEGLKVRVTETPISIEFIDTLGGKAVPITYAALYSALAKGEVDGGGQPLNNIVSAKFYEHQKYLTITRHTYTPQSLLMSKKTWDKLSAEEKKIVRDAADEARDFERRLSQENTAQALAFLKSKMAVNELPQSEMDRMRDKVKPVVDKYSREYGETLARELFDAIAKVRTARK